MSKSTNTIANNEAGPPLELLGELEARLIGLGQLREKVFHAERDLELIAQRAGVCLPVLVCEMQAKSGPDDKRTIQNPEVFGLILHGFITGLPAPIGKIPSA